MKEKELRTHTVCSICHKKIMHTGLPLFWVVSIERFGIDMKAVGRAQGLQTFFGGTTAAVVLANVMGPDEEMTTPMMDKVVLTICEDCSCSQNHCVAAMAEMGRQPELGLEIEREGE